MQSKHTIIRAAALTMTLALALGCGSLSALAASEEAAEAAAVETEIAAAISEDEALAAALKDAGQTDADVTVTRTRLSEKTTEAGEAVAVYSIKFSSDTASYKYYVDAGTGKIVFSSVTVYNTDVLTEDDITSGHGKASGKSDGKASGEIKIGRGDRKSDAEETDADTAATEDAASAETAEANGSITAEEAQAAALRAAGVKEADAADLETRRSRLAGLSVYKVSLTTETAEYEYTIQASDGVVLVSEIATGESLSGVHHTGKTDRGAKSDEAEADLASVLTDSASA